MQIAQHVLGRHRERAAELCLALDLHPALYGGEHASAELVERDHHEAVGASFREQLEAEVDAVAGNSHALPQPEVTTRDLRGREQRAIAVAIRGGPTSRPPAFDIQLHREERTMLQSFALEYFIIRNGQAPRQRPFLQVGLGILAHRAVFRNVA